MVKAPKCKFFELEGFKDKTFIGSWLYVSTTLRCFLILLIHQPYETLILEFLLI